MPSSTQMKKEEAAFRKIAKQSRIAREEAAARNRKQKQQERRKAAAAESAAAGASLPTTASAASTSGSHEAKAQKRKGAIILPEEVADLRRRLFAGEPSSSGSPVAQKAKVPKSKLKQSGGGKKAAQQTAPVLSSSLSPRPEPPFSMEVHHKNKQILVDVTLHHVPGAHVDVGETTDTMLVVDTAKHTKKYRLELPMPEGLRVDAANATYEMDCDCGVLRCVLPIKGDIPQELAEQREKMLGAIRNQKALRFRMGADGELKVRSRQALLLKNAREDAAQRSAKRAREEENTAEEEEAEEEEQQQHEEEAIEHTTEEVDKKTPKEERRKETNGGARAKSPIKKKAKKEPTTVSTEKTTKPQPPHSEQKPKTEKKKSGANAIEEERRRALSLAKAAGKAAQLTLRESIARAKAVQQKRMERLQTRTDRREVRTERTQNSFARVLEEQKRQLLARAELASSITAAEKRAQEKRKSNGKTVSFAAGN